MAPEPIYVYPVSLLGNGALKILPWQRMHTQECKNSWPRRFLCGPHRIKERRKLLVVIPRTLFLEDMMPEFGLFEFPFRFLFPSNIGSMLGLMIWNVLRCRSILYIYVNWKTPTKFYMRLLSIYIFFMSWYRKRTQNCKRTDPFRYSGERVDKHVLSWLC
jgi:hypothetical protein